MSAVRRPESSSCLPKRPLPRSPMLEVVLVRVSLRLLSRSLSRPLPSPVSYAVPRLSSPPWARWPIHMSSRSPLRSSPQQALPSRASLSASLGAPLSTSLRAALRLSVAALALTACASAPPRPAGTYATLHPGAAREPHGWVFTVPGDSAATVARIQRALDAEHLYVMEVLPHRIRASAFGSLDHCGAAQMYCTLYYTIGFAPAGPDSTRVAVSAVGAWAAQVYKVDEDGYTDFTKRKAVGGAAEVDPLDHSNWAKIEHLAAVIAATAPPRAPGAGR